MKAHCFQLLAAALIISGACLDARAAEEASVLSRNRPMLQYIAPGRWRSARRKGLPKDPVPPLDEDDLKLLKGPLTSTKIKKLVAGYLDRMTEFYSENLDFSDDLTAFFNKNKKAKEIFISALTPRYDNIPEAVRIFDELRSMDEKNVAKYAHLATAIAVVYDTPDAVTSSRYTCIWGVTPEQFTEPPDYKDIWKYYTNKLYARRFAFSLDKLPWPILVHLVDNEASPRERGWAVAKYNARTSIEKLYPSVQYDYDKLNTRSSGKLGNNPYILENLLRFGGVCGDQAHFTTRVAKSLGIPAMKVSGEGRYGGTGHAWAGYLVIRKGRPFLEFTGRFFFDYYYTGDVFDPQTRTMTLDRYVAMVYDGASLSYAKYNQSQMLVRMAEAIKAEHPEESLTIVQAAIKLNYFNMWGWPLLMQHIKEGTLDKKKGLKWFNEMLRVLKNHPDMTFECLNTFVDSMPEEDQKGRQAIYNQAFALYKKRPDLQLKLRMTQCEELVRTGKKLVALNALIPTIVQNSKEGKLVIPATRMAVKLAKEFNVQRQAYAMLLKADAGFPKYRQGRASEAYTEFKELLNQLR